MRKNKAAAEIWFDKIGTAPIIIDGLIAVCKLVTSHEYQSL